MKIRYNAPVVLNFALISVLVLFLNPFLGGNLITAWFVVPGQGYFDTGSVISYVRLISHIAGHVSWEHLLGNFAIILLVGPILEEKYGSFSLLLMIIITALVTGILNSFLFEGALLGASGVAFMMILLAPFTNTRPGEIPLTFILIIALYIVKEVFQSFQSNDIAEFAHIAGGFCGSIFGFIKQRHRLKELESIVDND
ncbi:MAG: rhomboid family intramembrane serine protease [Spirochaetales bacterium]|nr:rhomboid family intramembrane serine protease [Spirochaetales bacterium]